MTTATHRFATPIVALLLLGAAPAAAHPPGGHAPPRPRTAADDRDERTVAFLEARLAEEPRDPIALSKLGRILLRQARRHGGHGDLLAAEHAFQAWLAVEPDSHAAHLGLAHALLGRHRFRAALDAARAATRLRPGDRDARAVLGDVHLALGHDAEAEAIYAVLAAERPTFHALVRLGMMHEHRGRLDAADDAYHEALEVGRMTRLPAPDLAWCHSIIGEFDLAGGAEDDAAAHFRAALELDPGAVVAARHLAEIDARRGDLAGARVALERLASTHARSDVWIALADVLARDGDRAAAEQWLDRAERTMAAEVEEGDLGHARALVELWLRRGRETGRAVELALRDLHEVRRDAGAYETAAWALHHAGRHDEAVAHVQAALARSASDARRLWRASEIHRAAGDETAAAVLLSRALERNPLVEETARHAAR